MRLAIMSDLHLEFDSDLGRSFCDDLDSTDVDVLVLAGDVLPWTSQQNLKNVFNRLCEKYPHVIYVLGNHEFYRCDFLEVHKQILEFAKLYNNLHILNNNLISIDGQEFYGGTGWFPDLTGNERFKNGMNDFWMIENFEPNVYTWNEEFNINFK